MKKQILHKIVMVALFMGSGINYLSAQIADFNEGRYYQILINNFEAGKDQFALGMADDMEEACLQQFAIDTTKDNQLWKIEQVVKTDTTYRIVNKLTGKALGVSSWRNAPEEGQGQGTSTSPSMAFDWNGKHPGVVQLTYKKSSKNQQWKIIAVSNSANTITPVISSVIYQVKANWDLDSAKYWNFWTGNGGIGEGKKVIAIFPTKLAEGDRIGKSTNYYCFYFIKTNKVSTDVKQVTTNNQFKVIAQNGTARITGNIQGKLVQVYNMQGQVLLNSVVSGSEVNVRLKNTGIYIVKVDNQVNKFVLQ